MRCEVRDVVVLDILYVYVTGKYYFFIPLIKPCQVKVVDILKDHTFDPTDCQVSKCGTKNCKTCYILITDNFFSSNFTKRSFSTHSFENLSCRSYNLVYAIECTLCGLIYVGETKGQLRS